MSAIDVEAQVREARERHQWMVDLVRKEEKLANEDPAAYRAKVRKMALLGYGYIFGVLLLSVLAIGGIVWMIIATRASGLGVKLLIVAGIIVFSIVRALWVKFDAPDGLKLSRAEVPTLYAEVDSIAERLQAPKPEEIIIDEELNAAAAQHPRLGIFGWYKNTLILGMPLLLTLSPDEARSVIAHEFGHFSGQHGKFGVWIYRVNQTWSQLYNNFTQHGHGSWLFKGFVNWFQPRFYALSFALRRADEYEADAAAAKIAGADVAARALMRLPFLDKHVQESFWEPFYKQAQTLPAPPVNAFSGMPAATRVAANPEVVHEQLKIAFKAQTGYSDSHPSLSDRLTALKKMPGEDLEVVSTKLAEPLARSAAEEFFGERLPSVLQKLEDHYRARVAENWAEYHRDTQADVATLAELEAKAELTEEEAVHRISLVFKLRGEEEAEPLLRASLEKYPDNAALNFLMGRLLLERKDEAGLALLDRTLELEPESSDLVRRTLAQYHYERGEMERVEEIRAAAMEAHYREQATQSVALQLALGHDLVPHTLSPDDLTKLQAALATTADLDRAYIVKRPIQGADREVHCLIVFPPKRFIVKGDEGDKLVQRIVDSVPFGGIIFTFKERKAWEKKLDAIPGALVYQAPK